VTGTTFDYKWFMEEVSRFIKLLGERSSWEMIDGACVADRAMNGMLYSFMRFSADTPQEVESAASLMRMCVCEYGIREKLIMKYKLTGRNRHGKYSSAS